MYKFKFESSADGVKAYVENYCHSLRVWSYFGEFATRTDAKRAYANNPSFN